VCESEKMHKILGKILCIFFCKNPLTKSRESGIIEIAALGHRRRAAKNKIEKEHKCALIL